MLTKFKLHLSNQAIRIKISVYQVDGGSFYDTDCLLVYLRRKDVWWKMNQVFEGKRRGLF